MVVFYLSNSMGHSVSPPRKSIGLHVLKNLDNVLPNKLSSIIKLSLYDKSQNKYSIKRYRA